MHNDGTLVSPEKFFQTREDLIAQFGAVSFSPLPVQGTWLHEGVRYEDESRRITVDVDDTDDHLAFFNAFKQTLMERFAQLEIYIVSFPVEIH